MDRYYIENKKGMFHVMFERCHSKVLNHYTRYSITDFNTKEKAINHMIFLSKQTGTEFSL